MIPNNDYVWPIPARPMVAHMDWHAHLPVSHALLLLGCAFALASGFILFEWLHDVWIRHRWWRARRRVLDALQYRRP